MHSILTSLKQDLQFALRQLRRAPGFAAITVATLALGVGAATAVFSVIDATLLRPLPYAHQDRLVFPDTTARAGYTQPFSYPSYLDVRAQLSTFDALAGYTDYLKINLESPSGPISLTSVRGTDNFFTVLGIRPSLGRTFLPGEDQPGRDTVAVLSYEVWQSDFGGRADVVGKVVHLDGSPVSIIGVMPAGFRFPLSARNAIYKPLDPEPKLRANRGTHWMRTVGVLKPGVTRLQAQADFSRILANIGTANPDSEAGRTVRLVPLDAALNGQFGAPLKTLAFAVLALLAIACVNVAGLLLARGIQREREMALRTAVGAARSRIVRQVLTEGFVLAFAGLALGVLFAYGLLGVMRTFLITALARGVDIHLNPIALAFAVIISGTTSVLSSLIPALRLSRTEPSQALRSGVATGASRGQQRLRSGFVIAQVALSLLLLVISGILIRNLRALLNTPLGFEPSRILTTAIQLSPGEYEHRDPLATFYRPLLDRVAHLPGVQAVGLINALPIQNWGINSDIHIAGQSPNPPQLETLAEVRFVSPGYFDAMGIKIVSGRMLSPAEDVTDLTTSSVVVNEAFRRKFFSGGSNPVGARTDEGDRAYIVGLVTDVRQTLTEPPLAEMDWIIDEIPAQDRLGYLNNMSLLIRSNGKLTALVPALRSTMHQIDPTIPFQTPETMAQVVGDSLVFERMEDSLFGIFGALAILLTVIGLYGLAQHEVELRTREIGIRLALGSSRARVVRQIIARTAALMTVGIAGGWALTAAVQRMLASVVVLHPAKDLLLFALLTTSLLFIGILAAWLPARRAAAIDPMQALRTE